MQNAAAYIRVSDERQDEFSPDSQLKLIREYCRSNELLLSDGHIFYDDGISAKSAQKRKEFCRMIELAKSREHPFDVIVVWKYSRFARIQEESIVYKSLLRKHGVRVASVSEPSADDPFSSLVERIIEWMDEYYIVRLSGEVKRGMTEKALRGQPNNPAPIGYDMNNKQFTVNRDEAEIIKSIFSLFVGGLSASQIAERLNADGYRTRKGNLFESRTVKYILQNPVYAGYIRWSRDGRMASNRHFDSENFIIRKGLHEPIISDDEYTAAQKRLYEQSKKNKKAVRRS